MSDSDNHQYRLKATCQFLHKRISSSIIEALKLRNHLLYKLRYNAIIILLIDDPDYERLTSKNVTILEREATSDISQIPSKISDISQIANINLTNCCYILLLYWRKSDSYQFDPTICRIKERC